MDAFATPEGLALAPGFTSLSVLSPGTAAVVRGVGARLDCASPLERRLVELGFVSGERIEVLAQARPGGDPFVVRIADTTPALRRREVETVWVELAPPAPHP